MDRRSLIKISLASGTYLALSGCAHTSKTSKSTAMTVNGPISTTDMGWTLPHEHLFLDFRPLEKQLALPINIDFENVSSNVLPHLQEVKKAGIQTIVDPIAVGAGRSPTVLKKLSTISDVNIIMATGAYLTANEMFIPQYVREEDNKALAARWISEFTSGIDGTDVHPGMIKLGINGGKLSELDKKIVDAAAITHLATGMVIGVHIGPWGGFGPGFIAEGAKGIIERFKALGVSPSAFIWIHTQNEAQFTPIINAAKMGAFISFDGYRPGQEKQYGEFVRKFKEAGVLSQIHLSQDAGWYTLGDKDGGDFSPFTPIMTDLIPYLKQDGVTDLEIEQIFIQNPATAFALEKRSI